ncbi:uncharacterized protein [Prorops nasuta]|uniref:uncharacterized protein n=1 Tax=Prorops nasuta TaxID=863751 RepID=UPI0034CF238A
MEIRNLIKCVIIFQCFFQINGVGISCFKCIANPQTENETNLMCSNFDGSSKYQTYCPSSTLCMSRTTYFKYPNGTSIPVAVERDCAAQKYRFQSYDSFYNKWFYQEEVITTAYAEGCFTGEDRGSPSGPPLYCFCSFHLCNSSYTLKTNIIYLISIAMLLIYLSY